jgi:hypothetical protein
VIIFTCLDTGRSRLRYLRVIRSFSTSIELRGIREKTMRTRVWIKLLLVIILCGCATTHNYEKNLNLFVGLPLSNLVSSWGKPQNMYSLSDGTTVVEYRTYQIVDKYVSTPYIPEYSGDSFIPPGTYIQTPDMFKKVLWCRTKFIVNKNGIVDSWSHEGNDCKR